MTDRDRVIVSDRIRQRIDHWQEKVDRMPRAIITEELGRIWITHTRREPLPSEGYAVKRIAELVEDGWRIHDPHNYLRMWASFCDEPPGVADADAAGYPDTPLPAGGTPMGDALMEEEEFLRTFEREGL